MMQTILFLSMLAPAQLPMQGAAYSPAPCPAPCAAPCDTGKSVCVSEPTTKKHSKTVYSSKCSEVCYKKCSLLGNLFGGSGDCGCTDCGIPRHKSVLVKKIVTTECPDTKCVAKPADCGPVCSPGIPVK